MKLRRLGPALTVAAMAMAACAGGGSGKPAATAEHIESTIAPSSSVERTTPVIDTSTSSAITTTTTATTLTAAPTTAPLTDTDRVRQCVSSWPIEQQAALLVWPSVYSADWRRALRVVDELELGGVVLMKPSDRFALRLADHVAELDAVAAHGVLVATDEEGGAVQRLRALGPVPSQEEMSARSDEEIRATIDRHAAIVAEAGVDVVLAPVVDVRPMQGQDPLGSGRLFVGDPTRVAHLARLYVDAWSSAGVLPVLKHFPGHGSATADTHQRLAVTPPLAELRQRDLLPYVDLSTSGAGVMVGHLSVPGLTDGEPATRSPAAISLLRDELGFADALVMTDALGMGAVGQDEPTAAVNAITSGIDVAIFTDTDAARAVLEAIVAAVRDGRIGATRFAHAVTRVALELERHGNTCRPA